MNVKLIELVLDHPCVFNSKHPMYKDAHVRYNVYTEIGAQMKFAAEEYEHRWKNIRDTYMRHKRAKKLSTGSASSKKIQKWHLEKHLNFINVVDCERQMLTNNTVRELDIIDPIEEPDTIYEDGIIGNVEVAVEPELPTSDGMPKQSKKKKNNY